MDTPTIPRLAQHIVASVCDVRRACDEGRLTRELAWIGHADLLIVDELGFLPLDTNGARLLF
jgi:DNA replication protein DnaC